VEYKVRESTSFKIKADYVKENKQNLEIMLLGSSQSWRGINPKYIDFKVAPLTNGGASFNLNYLIFKEYVDQLPNLKVVILEMAYHSPEYYLGDSYNKNNLYHIYYNVNNYDSGMPLSDRTLLTSNTKEYLKIFFEKFNTKSYINEYGFLRTPNPYGGRFHKLGFDSTEIANTSGAYLGERHAKNNLRAYGENKANLEEIVRICKSKGIKLVLLSTPKYYLYNDNMIDKKLRRRNELVRSVRDNSEVFFWNYETGKAFDIRDFADEDHLNAKGAEKFTKMLNVRLKKLYQRFDL
jgi:hypothetical protein